MNNDVVIFTVPGCTSCERTKAFLEEHEVPFVERSLAGDAGAMNELVALGARRLPVVRIGDEMISGFDQARLRALLGLAAEGG
jgi:glutaredoxin-like protein NrdH